MRSKHLRRVAGRCRRLAGAAGVVGLLLLGSAGARAAEASQVTTIVVFGDSQARGLARGLQRDLVENPRFRVLDRAHPGAAIAHDDSQWLTPIQHFLAHDHAGVAIVMLGANDRIDMEEGRGRYLHFRSDAWRDAYAARVDKILSAFAAAHLKVIWCGNPIAHSGHYSDDMQYINGIFAAETKRFGVEYVSLWDAVADAHGHYTAYGKDRDGVTRRLRADDGIHFTRAGYELVAEKLMGHLSAAEIHAARAP